MLPRMYVSRPRLLESLSQATQCKLTVVCADAGYGKTSLVTEFTRSSGFRSEWHQLTSMDRDTARLAEGLGGCLRHLANGSEPVGTVGTRPRRAKASDVHILTEFLLTLASHVPPEVAYLVLDDYQSVDQEPDANLLLGSLIENSPPYLRFIILSRGVPRFSLGKLMARQEVCTIEEDALSFTVDETAEFLNSGSAPGLEEATIALAQERTEGWPAGVAMVSQSLRYGGRDKVLAVLADPAASAWLVYDYLAGEVFDRQEPAVREFLIQTSVLSTMSGEVCDHLLGIASSFRTLLTLEERGLFTASMDPARQTFRYHQLFREFLRQKLHQLESREVVEALHLRAGEFYESHGEWEECVAHYLRAGEPMKATVVVESIGEKHVMAGFLQTVEKWLKSLPEDLTATRPWLLVLRARLSYLAVNNQEALRLLERALRAFQTGGDRYGEAYALREIGFVKTRSHQTQQAVRQYELALSRADGISHLKGTVLCRLGRVYRDAGRLDEAVEACRQAFSEAEGIVQETQRLEICSNAGRQMALALMQKGDLKAALKAAMESLDLGAAHDLGEYERTWEFIDLGTILWGFGEFDGCIEAENRALSLSGRHIRQVQERIGSWLGTALRDSGRFAEAERAYAFGGWEGSLDAAFMAVLTRPADAALSGATELDHHWRLSDNIVAKSSAKVILAAALREAGDPSSALMHIRDGIQTLREGGYRFRLASALLHQARIEYDLSLPEARETLASALGLAAADWYSHFFWWDPRLVAFLCEKALEAGIQPEYAAQLMDRRLRGGNADPSARLTSGTSVAAQQRSGIAPTQLSRRALAERPAELLASCADPQIKGYILEAVDDDVISGEGVRALRVDYGLTWREIHVFIEYYLRQPMASTVGNSPLRQDCARNLGISAYTVRYHVSNIRGKLGLPASLSGRGILGWVRSQDWLTAAE